jgi:RNA polymerase subunit RPABC4/transcription elongation factor Spt4
MFRKKKPKRVHHIICPHCGAVIPADSRACPECGSDSQTGWSDYGNLADAFAPEESEKERENRGMKKTVVKYVTAGTGIVLVYGLIAAWIPHGVYIGIPVVIAIVIALLILWGKPFSGLWEEKALEQEFLAMAGHDPERVERLIQFEQVKDPNASRLKLLRAAYNRLLRDRR